MHRFSVWAPAATSVDLVLAPPADDESAAPTRLAMSRVTTPLEDGEVADGWWHLDVPQAGAGSDYAFSLDGGEPMPDPRSAWQPGTVHGYSRVADTGAHQWHDEAWKGLDLRGRVIYELHIGTLTAEGTLDAAARHLDHLVSLGVDAVELMPVAAFPGRWGWGYDGVLLYAVHDQYGGPGALQRFVDACHRRGLAVVLDVVYNHLGPSGNYLLQYGPYFTDKHHTPWGMAVNLDAHNNGPVRRYLIDNALRWFRDFHVDGLRLDAVHELQDDSDYHLLAQLSDETSALARELDRPLTLIAESDLNDAVMVTPTTRGGRGMSAQWDDDVHHALHALLTGEQQGYYTDFGSIATLAKTLTKVFMHDGAYSTFRGENWGAPVDTGTISGHAFLAYTTTHDQTGNRAVGDRLSASLSLSRQAIAAALVLTSPFTPMLFMGEEFAASTPWQFFTDHAEPELAQSIRDGRRAEFASHGWSAEQIPDPQDPATRDASVLDWDEAEDSDGARLQSWYRALIALRRREPDLRSGDLRAIAVDFDEDARWLIVRRGAYRVVVNLAQARRTITLDRPGQLVVLAFSGASLHGRSVRLPADSVALVKVDDSPTVKDAITGYLAKTLDELTEAVASDNVHDMRVSCRRIRSILRAHARAWPASGREQSVVLAERAREIARALSADRDHEVAGEVIDDWAAADAWPEADREAVLRALYPPLDPHTPQPRPAVPAPDPGLSPHDARSAAGQLAADVQQFLQTARWRGRAYLPARVGLAPYRTHAAQRVIDRAATAAVTHPAEDPHELWHLVRKAAKRLRYTAEAAANVADHNAKDIAAAAKSVQTVIGDLQDARLVLDRLERAAGVPVATAASRAEATIAARSDAIQPALERLRSVVPEVSDSPAIPPDVDGAMVSSAPHSAPDSSTLDNSDHDSGTPDSSAPDSSAPDSSAPDSSAPHRSASGSSDHDNPADSRARDNQAPGSSTRHSDAPDDKTAGQP